MKYLLPLAAAAILLFAYGVQNAHALTTYQVFQGGTGRTTFSSSQLLYGNGKNALSSIATTSVSCSGSVSCAGFTAIGASPITITGSAGGTLSPFATTTSTVVGRNIVYPLNDTDILTIGANATTSEFWFDPNIDQAYMLANVGINSLNPYTYLTINASTTASSTGSQVRLQSTNGGIGTGSLIGGIDFISRDSQILDVGGIRAGNITVEGNRTHTATVVDSDMVFRTVGGVGTDLLEKMRLAANGVGIGTSTPFGSFSVQAFNTANRMMSFTNSSGVEIASLTSTGELGLVGTTTSAASNFGLGVTTGTAAGNNTDNVARLVHGASGQTGATLVVSGIRAANSGFNLLEIGPDYDGTYVPQFVFRGDGRLGVGTTTPGHLIDIYATGTSTLRVDSNSATQGSCVVLKDSDGSGYTYVTAANGVLTASTIACN